MNFGVLTYVRSLSCAFTNILFALEYRGFGSLLILLKSPLLYSFDMFSTDATKLEVLNGIPDVIEWFLEYISDLVSVNAFERTGLFDDFKQYVILFMCIPGLLASEP